MEEVNKESNLQSKNISEKKLFWQNLKRPVAVTTRTKILIGILVIIVLGVSGWWVWNWYSIGKKTINISVDGKIEKISAIKLPLDQTGAWEVIEKFCKPKNPDYEYSYEQMEKINSEWKIPIINVNCICGATINVKNGETKCKVDFLSNRVVITTDKTEYEQGERVKATISNVDKPIYVSYTFGTGVSFYQLKENLWTKLTTSCPTNCIEFCEDNTIRQKPCPMEVPPEYLYYEYKGPWEIQWNQEECIYETKLCGTKTYSEGSLKQVSVGKFKIELCYFDKEDVDLSKRPGYAMPDKKKCIEDEFTIKEKTKDKKSCNEDDDCMLVDINCCGCAAGGGKTCINKSFRKEWYRRLDCSHSGNMHCPEEYNCDFILTGCECINNTCQGFRK